MSHRPRKFGCRTTSGQIAHDEARILVVDDVLWEIFRRHLLTAGYADAYAVRSATEGMRELREASLYGRNYDMVILDVTLSLGDLFRDGCAMGRAISQEWPGTRLLFVSGYDREELPASCPVDLPLLLKPAGREEFLARVLETLQLPPYEWRD